MPPPDPNNTYIKPPSENQILEFIKTLGYDEDPETKMIAVSKMVATRLHQPWRAILSVLNRSLMRKDSSWDTVRLPILKILWEVPDAMISDAIKKKAGYTYYMAKKVESEKAKIVDEPKEQHISLVKSGRGKGFMCYGDQVANVPNKLKKDDVPRKTRYLTIVEETVVGPTVEDPTVQSLTDLRKGSKASRLESLKQKKQAVVGEGSSAAHNKYYDDSDIDNDNPHGYNDAVGYGVFMHNKSTATPNSTYLSPTVTSSSIDFIQTLLDETHANELTDFMSHLVYTGAQTTSVVHNPEGNPEITSYISGASEVPLGIHVDVLATKTLMQEIFPDKNAHHTPSPSAKKIPYPTTTPQPNSLQAKAKKLTQKAKKNIRKINFKKAVAQKFKEYDQKLEALINFSVSKAFKKAVQAKVLTEIKKLLPTHISNAIVNYVKPRLNTFVLEVMKTNQINLFTQSSTSTDDLSEIDLKSHDNQDLPNNREWENKKKHQKDVSKPSSRSQDIDKVKNHILGPLTVAIAKKFKELIQKDELTIANFEGVGLERLK
ncbi:hypothetical protein Tco_1444436, partial [Tanacetum coccineum]